MFSNLYGKSRKNNDIVDTVRPEKSDFSRSMFVNMYHWQIKDRIMGVYMMKQSDENYIVVGNITNLSISVRAYHSINSAKI